MRARAKAREGVRAFVAPPLRRHRRRCWRTHVHARCSSAPRPTRHQRYRRSLCLPTRGRIRRRARRCTCSGVGQGGGLYTQGVDCLQASGGQRSKGLWVDVIRRARARLGRAVGGGWDSHGECQEVEKVERVVIEETELETVPEVKKGIS